MAKIDVGVVRRTGGSSIGRASGLNVKTEVNPFSFQMFFDPVQSSRALNPTRCSLRDTCLDCALAMPLEDPIVVAPHPNERIRLKRFFVFVGTSAVTPHTWF